MTPKGGITHKLRNTDLGLPQFPHKDGMGKGGKEGGKKGMKGGREGQIPGIKSSCLQGWEGRRMGKKEGRWKAGISPKPSSLRECNLSST